MKFIVIQMDESNDLNCHEFEWEAEAVAFVESSDQKAYLIKVNGEYEVEPYT